jgi:hypothetical protein
VIPVSVAQVKSARTSETRRHPRTPVSRRSLDDALQGDKDFDRGAAKKFFIDPHGCVA